MGGTRRALALAVAVCAVMVAGSSGVGVRGFFDHYLRSMFAESHALPGKGREGSFGAIQPQKLRAGVDDAGADMSGFPFKFTYGSDFADLDRAGLQKLDSAGGFIVKRFKTEWDDDAARKLQVEQWTGSCAKAEKLSDSCIAKCLGNGCVGRECFQVQERVGEHTFADELAQDERDVKKAFRVFRSVAAAIVAMSDEGVSHNDVKPGSWRRRPPAPVRSRALTRPRPQRTLCCRRRRRARPSWSTLTPCLAPTRSTRGTARRRTTWR